MIDNSVKERFWNKVNIEGPDDCWEWKAGKTNGYGRFYIDRYNPISAHRMSWKLANGLIPHDKIVLHKCDNKLCVNPNHLYAGTYRDNRRDAGERNPIPSELSGMGHVRFYSGEIWLIRKLRNVYSKGITLRYKIPATKVAKIFRTSRRTILNIWKAEKYLCKEGYYI